MSNNTVNAAPRRLGVRKRRADRSRIPQYSKHSAERTGLFPDVIELQLARAERNEIREYRGKFGRSSRPVLATGPKTLWSFKGKQLHIEKGQSESFSGEFYLRRIASLY